MSFPITPIYALDIETDTTVNGLDPKVSKIIAVAVSCSRGDNKVFTGSEVEILTKLERYIRKLPDGVIVTWNGAVFDLPFLMDRYQTLGVDTTLEIAPDLQVHIKYEPLKGHKSGYKGRWGYHAHCDISPLYYTLATKLGLRHGLKPVAREILGIEPIEVDRTQMHRLSNKQLYDYAISDTDITLGLASFRRQEVYENVDQL
jgi:DNA polymerase elongation subunit (family B)